MDFTLGSALLAGVAGTAAMTVVLSMAPAMGMRMDMPAMLGTMFLPLGAAARLLGLAIHFGMGALFFLVYAALFDGLDLSGALAGWGALFGIVHGLVAGAAMGMMPAMHPRMAEGPGAVPPPGVFGARLGAMAPMAILLLHALYGAVGGAVYAV